MGRPPREPDEVEHDPEYEAALARYVAANPLSPQAQDWRQLEGSPAGAAGPADVGGIKVSRAPRPMGNAASMVDQLAAGAAPAPTPEGEALFADLQSAGRASKPPEPSLVDRLASGAAELFTSPGLLQAFRNEPRTERTPLQALSDKVEDWRNPLPEGELPLPGAPPAPQLPPEAPPKRAPRVQVGYAAETPERRTAVAGTADPGPLPRQHPAVAKALESIRGAPAAAEQGDTDLDAALRQSADRRLLAGLTRAGGAAIGRGKGEAYDNLDEQADRPLAELQMRRADATAGEARAAAAAEKDPASPQSQQARALLQRMAPELAKDPAFANLSAERAKALFPWLKELGDREAQSAALKAKSEEARLGRENAVNVANIRARGKGGGPGGLKRVDLERFTQKAAQETEGFADMQGDLGVVLKAAEKEDVAGVGPGAGFIPDILTSKEGTENRRAARRLVENLLKAQSGLAASDREQVRKLASTSLSDRASDADWRAGARELAKFVRRAMQSREAAFPPEAIQLLQQRGGTTSRDIPTGAPGPGGGAPGWSDADEKRLQELEAKARAGR